MFHQGRRKHQPSMALERIFFRAEHGHHVRLARLSQTIKPFAERGRSPDLLVINPPIGIIEPLVVRPPPKLFTQKRVDDVVLVEGALQLRAVELRITLAERLRANVRNRIDSCILKQLQKASQLMV